MKRTAQTFVLFFTAFLLSSFTTQNDKTTYSLTIEVIGLRNSKGVVQYALYHKDGTIPDEHYKRYYKISTGTISNGTSSFTFTAIPAGKYAVNILHDENMNGKIDRGFILPIEGLGFSNFQTIGLSNRPNFPKASFEVNGNKTVSVKVIYM